MNIQEIKCSEYFFDENDVVQKVSKFLQQKKSDHFRFSEKKMIKKVARNSNDKVARFATRNTCKMRLTALFAVF